MTQSGENKELKAAFDEFKELLEKRVEPVFDMPPMSPTAPEPHEQLHAAFGSELRASAPTFKIPVSNESASLTASSTTPDNIAPSPRIDLQTQSHLTPKSGQNKRAQPLSPQAQRHASEASDGRRRKLIYLSGAIILSGLAALGWTLSNSKHAEETPELTRARAPEAATTSQGENSTGDALNNGQAPASQNLAGQDPAGQAPSQDPAPPAQPTAVEPATPPEARQPEQAQTSAPLPPKAAPAAAPAALQSTQAPPLKAKPKIAPAAPPPAKTTTSAEPSIEMSQPSKPKPKVVKPKPRPAASSAPSTAQNPPPAADNASPPPPPPPSNDGPFGFVKRTVNSITDIGRGAIGGN